MKTIEDIEKEYNVFKRRIGTVKSVEELEGWIEVIFGDIIENIRVLRVDYKNNRMNKIVGYIRNLFPFIYETEDLSIYDKDNKLLEEAFWLNKIYENYFKQIIYYSNENNIKEMSKLTDFLSLYYEKDLDYIYGERADLEYTQKGYGCINNRDEDNSEVVHEFFINKLNELSEVKGIEKVMKM